ncbi:hypothetical protein M2281_005078 [Mesorhizobium soli]|uniref:DUF6665 family protein n=1 Tax=Pseudaminobacter soli (ex Li et al. 2025) TaxID=1295366 RepID=UPI00247702FB|nr:DUF6665 family protein [Mesorhizobium soli]MDH6234460.1 hypothetical protein [Mesorhizobium soli]
MSLRPPSQRGPGKQNGVDVLGHELAEEMAVSLGRAGRRAEQAVVRLRDHNGPAEERVVLLKAAAESVHAYFIQRELCGLRRHDDVIRDYAIPREVLVRLGAM